MDENRHRIWDIIIKLSGIFITAMSIYLGLTNFNKQQNASAELEFKRNFWRKQIDVYSELCKNAGSLIASIDNDEKFAVEKDKFISLYYGEIILVEDQKVDSAIRELKSYLEIVQPKDPNMVNTLKLKVIELSEACKASISASENERLTDQ